MKVTVSQQDQHLLNRMKWYINGRGYVINSNDSRISLHRLVMGNPSENIDHINGDKLDNRRENLRICNQSQNCANSKLSKNNTSGYKGVSWNKALSKWHSFIMVRRKRIHLGYFEDKNEAAKSYNDAAKKHFGEFARLNEVTQ